jgi:hypothetical protein
MKLNRLLVVVFVCRSFCWTTHNNMQRFKMAQMNDDASDLFQRRSCSTFSPPFSKNRKGRGEEVDRDLIFNLEVSFFE